MTPAASCPPSTLCQTKPQLTSITVHHAHQLIRGLQTPSSNTTWGKFVLLSLSVGNKLPPLPSDSLCTILTPAPTLPLLFSSLFRVTFLPYSLFIRERQHLKAFHKFLSYIPLPLHLPQTHFLWLLPVTLACQVCLQGFHKHCSILLRALHSLQCISDSAPILL